MLSVADTQSTVCCRQYRLCICLQAALCDFWYAAP